MIRGATGGHFDHVALVVRTDNEGPQDFSIVEAVGNEGVTSTTWKKISSEIGADKFYEKCCFRKLIGSERNKQWLKLFDDFLEEAWEHDYAVNLGKLRPRGSFTELLDNEDGKRWVEADRTFFCSELIAKCYKALGVFKTEKSSANFYPSDFAVNFRKDEAVNPTLPF